MVTKKTILGLDFNTIEEYFDYIVESVINGQKEQARELFKDLSKEQRKGFLFHMNDIHNSLFVQVLDVVNLTY